MVDFHMTGNGRRFLERQVPDLIDAVKKIGKELERLNNNLEKIEKEKDEKENG